MDNVAFAGCYCSTYLNARGGAIWLQYMTTLVHVALCHKPVALPALPPRPPSTSQLSLREASLVLVSARLRYTDALDAKPIDRPGTKYQNAPRLG